MATSKLTNEEKLEELKKFLQENNVKYLESHHSQAFDLNIDLQLWDLKIAVFLSDGNYEKETAIVEKVSLYGKDVRLKYIYNPFFIRESESMEFILEKMQNCIIKRMTLMQKIWNKKQSKQKKP